MPLSFSQKYSNVEIEQVANIYQAVSYPFPGVGVDNGPEFFQTFTLPDQYRRGSYIPKLTGFQLLVSIPADTQANAKITWTLTCRAFGASVAIPVANGTSTGAETSGNQVWLTFYVKEIDIDPSWLDHQFSLGIQFDQTIVSPDAIWASSPNPLASQQNTASSRATGTALQVNGVDASFAFRVLAATADDGTDFLGNSYRSTVIASSAENVSTFDSSVKSKTWTSKPNPSKFGVESLYFDMSDSGGPAVINRIYIDPSITGTYCNIYWSNEGDPVSTDTEWNNKLWTRVPLNFHLDKTTTFALPYPITARYIKLEFTYLQPHFYDAGNFQRPQQYAKHPKWVLDYFLVRLNALSSSEDYKIGRGTRITYDAFDLAYNYYIDDLAQTPLSSAQLGPQDIADVNRYFASSPIADQVDSATLGRIDTRLRPYLNNLTFGGALDYALTSIAQATIARTTLNSTTSIALGLPTEAQLGGDTSNFGVSRLNRDPLIIEKNFPIMYFFVNCRHTYRTVSASLTDNRAYFAGLNEVAFLRDHYAVDFDQSTYIENPGDNVNSERNDFVRDNQIWNTYDTTN